MKAAGVKVIRIKGTSTERAPVCGSEAGLSDPSITPARVGFEKLHKASDLAPFASEPFRVADAATTSHNGVYRYLRMAFRRDHS